MSKLSQVLEDLEWYIERDKCADRDSRRNYMETVVTPAKAELLELQSLQSTVKEFIANNNVRNGLDVACLIGVHTDYMQELIEELCDIVGYSE